MITDKRFIYTVNYPIKEKEIALLEVKILFNDASESKTIISSTEFNPSDSAFIKSRLEILLEAETFSELILLLTEKKISCEEFKAEYFRLEDENIPYEERIICCREVGLRITGFPNMASPKKVFGITKFQNRWYLGIILKSDLSWLQRIDKPHSYSNSLGIKIAKAALNFATAGDKNLKIIDTCAGVGTIVIEGLASGIDIWGAEINPVIAQNACENLFHYGLPNRIISGNMHDIQKKYDVSILDIPYGIFSHITREEQQSLISKCREISKRMILISFEDLKEMVLQAGFEILETCSVPKGKFKRYIFICS